MRAWFARYNITMKYREKCRTPSDVNEDFPILKKYASSCWHITEFGVRNVTSTWAFLASFPHKMGSYDICRLPNIELALSLARKARINFTFIKGNVLESRDCQFAEKEVKLRWNT